MNIAIYMCFNPYIYILIDYFLYILLLEASTGCRCHVHGAMSGKKEQDKMILYASADSHKSHI